MAAPKGNKNAFKHGLYAKHISQEDQSSLRKMTPSDYQHEIGMMRVAVRNVFEIQVRLHKEVEEMMNAGQAHDVEALAKITNSLAMAMTALNNTARTYALFSGTETLVKDAFEEALNSLSIFLDDSDPIQSRADAEDAEEVMVE